MDAIETVGLTKRYGGLLANDNVAVTLAAAGARQRFEERLEAVEIHRPVRR